jgi:hypothetical protein
MGVALWDDYHGSSLLLLVSYPGEYTKKFLIASPSVFDILYVRMFSFRLVLAVYCD